MAKTLTERLKEEDALISKARAALTDADRAEIAQREELARKQEIRAREEEQARSLDLARRLDAALDRVGDDVALKELAIKDSAHSFILKDPGGRAYNEWMNGISKVTAAEMDLGKTKTSREAVNRVFAVLAVVDWNGATDFSGASTLGHDLHEFLKNYPAIASEIANSAVDLCKQAKETRKSGG